MIDRRGFACKLWVQSDENAPIAAGPRYIESAHDILRTRRPVGDGVTHGATMLKICVTAQPLVIITLVWGTVAGPQALLALRPLMLEGTLVGLQLGMGHNPNQIAHAS
jgi:hypothetical protein